MARPPKVVPLRGERLKWHKSGVWRGHGPAGDGTTPQDNLPGPTGLQMQWDPASPCSRSATEGLRVPGADSPQPPPCCIPWGEAPEVQTDGQGARSRFQLLFCSPSAHPTGRAVPVPIPVPIRAPPPRLPGSDALIYDLLGDKRGLLAAASNWCAGTTVAICLLGRWGGAAAGAGFCFPFHAPLNFAPFVSQRRV